MNKNEKLIEEAARRYPDNRHTGTTPLYAQMKREAFIDGAVFEKAHTTTDDEREALERLPLTSFDYADIDPSVRELADAILAAGPRRSGVSEPSEEHDCEFECGSAEEHLRWAYEALRNEYEGYRQWVRIAFSHNIAEADAKKIASRYVWHMTPSGGGLRNSARAMQAALSEYIKLRVNAAHAAQGSEGA